MIKFHPCCEMLNEYIAGELSLSLTVAVHQHINMCEQCQKAVQTLEVLQSDKLWEAAEKNPIDLTEKLQRTLVEQLEPSSIKDKPCAIIQVAGKNYPLEAAFSLFKELKWTRAKELSRARIILDGNDVSGRLLYIDKWTVIPKNRHGYELTLILEGEFTDENGSYHQGDFIYLEAEHTLFSESGCLCYIAQDVPFQFVSGWI